MLAAACRSMSSAATLASGCTAGSLATASTACATSATHTAVAAAASLLSALPSMLYLFFFFSLFDFLFHKRNQNFFELSGKSFSFFFFCSVLIFVLAFVVSLRDWRPG
jgi:hypothetical protein